MKKRKRSLYPVLVPLFALFALVFIYFYRQTGLDLLFLPCLGMLEVCSFLFIWVYLGISSRGKGGGYRDLLLMVIGVLGFFNLLWFGIAADEQVPVPLRHDFILITFGSIFGGVMAWFWWYFDHGRSMPTPGRRIPYLYLSVSGLILSLIFFCVFTLIAHPSRTEMLLWVMTPWLVLQPFLQGWLVPPRTPAKKRAGG